MEYSAWKIKCRDCGKSSLRSEPSPCPKCYSKNIEVTKALSVMERISLAANFIPLIAIIFSGLWLFGVFDDEKPTKRVTTAAKTIDRIIDVFPGSDKDMIRAMLASSLQGVVAQALLRRADGKGRVGAFEVLVGTGAVRNLIRENQIPQMYSMMQTGSRYGMVTMEDAVSDLYESGIIAEDEARRVLVETSDKDGDEESDEVAASLGGGKISDSEKRKSSDDGDDEGYSF